MAENLPALHSSRLPWHPIFEEYGIARTDWQALVEAVFPGAQSLDSIRMALSYCKRRNLDPFKRVIHIVPVWDNDQHKYVDTIWPGIAELRTTAFRTQQYAGADAAQFGDVIEQTWRDGNATIKVTYPAWAQLTVYRLVGGQRVPVPGPRVYWMETYSTKGRSDVPNERWRRAPHQMLEKCAEAAALRRAFPEELGDQHSEDEAGAFTRDVTPAPRLDEPSPAGPPLRGNERLRARLMPETATVAQEEREEPAAPEVAEEPGRRAGGRPRGSRNRPRDDQLTEEAIERSQEAIAAALGEEIEETQPEDLEPIPAFDGAVPSVFVPFDPGNSVQEWFGRARTRLREMEEARLPPDRYIAYRKANFGPLEALRKQLNSWWVQIDAIIAAGERGGDA